MSEYLSISYCPFCKKKLDAATDFDADCLTPKPGDLSVCIYCGNILKFCEDLSLQVAFKEDLQGLDKKALHSLMVICKAVEERNKTLALQLENKVK